MSCYCQLYKLEVKSIVSFYRKKWLNFFTVLWIILHRTSYWILDNSLDNSGIYMCVTHCHINRITFVWVSFFSSLELWILFNAIYFWILLYSLTIQTWINNKNSQLVHEKYDQAYQMIYFHFSKQFYDG